MQLNRLPAWAIEAGRFARTAALRIVSPAEQVDRALRRRPALPPLWLRRHAGPVRAFESSARDCRRQLEGWHVLSSNGTIVDLGCGPGAMALELSRGPMRDFHYVGIDVHAPSIAWCRRRFRGNGRFRFEVAPVRSPFGDGEVSVKSYRVPVDDGSAALVLAKSLFTHLSETEARRYLSEIARVLDPDGAAVVTAFLFRGDPPAFPFGDDSVRWRVRARPAAAIAFARTRFEKMIAESGLECAEACFGFYPGEETRISGQDVLLLRPASLRK